MDTNGTERVAREIAVEDCNPWEKRLLELACNHEANGLALEAQALRAIALARITTAREFKAALVACLNWADDDVEEETDLILVRVGTGGGRAS